MMRKMKEKINIFIAKSPKKAVLLGIMLFNITFIMIAAGIIAALSKYMSGITKYSFWEAAYHTVTMMLDAGCIDSVIEDVGKAGAVAALVCLTVVIVGMMFFSGAVIGYVTNSISDFIESKNNGKNKLHISDHIVIINWNQRAAEIMNEFLYANREVKVVVFVPNHRDEIDEEIRNRLETTRIKDAQQVFEAAEGMPFLEKKRYLRENLLSDKMTYIVREGDVAAATDLDDICITEAKTVILLDNEGEEKPSVRNREKGNTQTIKTLIQVSEISKENKNQMILVEVTDAWTEELVSQIIAFKAEQEDRTMIPVSYNRLLGKSYSQIAIMPELNEVYDNLFSNKGPHFISKNIGQDSLRINENLYIKNALAENCRSIPLSVLETGKGNKAFYMAARKSDLRENCEGPFAETGVIIKNQSLFRKRCILILGHNSNMDSLMAGFDSFREEWGKKGEGEILYVVMVDSEESLKRHNYYRDHPYVDTLAADVFDTETIQNKVLELSRKAPEETTVLILSDDSVEDEDVDANVLTYLIYIQGQIRQREREEPDFDREKLNVIVEILNPKNEDAVKSYGADQVVISNRYVSRIISQISLGEADYEFYEDILSYHGENPVGRKLLTIAAEDFFREIPPKCTARDLIQMVFAGGVKEDKSIVLGYIRDEREYIFFHGDQRKIKVELRPKDKLVLFSNHRIPR